VRCSSVPSSIAVIGVGVSLLGAFMRALDGLVWVSVVEGACVGESCGGGVGSCIGTSIADSTLLLVSNSCD
jgi:hypothetical protein